MSDKSLIIRYRFEGMIVHCEYLFITELDDLKEVLTIFDFLPNGNEIPVKNYASDFIIEAFKQTDEYKEFKYIVNLMTGTNQTNNEDKIITVETLKKQKE